MFAIAGLSIAMMYALLQLFDQNYYFPEPEPTSIYLLVFLSEITPCVLVIIALGLTVFNQWRRTKAPNTYSMIFFTFLLNFQ